MRRAGEAWPPGPARTGLDEDEVHVWRVALDVPAGHLARLRGLLAPEEAERAARCRIPRQRARFEAATGALREVLSRCTGTPPDRLRFVRGPRGRPSLLDPPVAGLDFNLSHSGGTALIAVGRGGRVGVDLEEIDPAVDHRGMARRFLPAAEAAEVCALPDKAGRRAFFARWTWREAYAKAEDCPLPRALPAAGAWRLWDLAVGPEACAALVAPRSVRAPHCWRY